MASFYYFLPGVTKDQLQDAGRLRREPLQAAGIDTLLFDVTRTPQHVSLAETHRCSGPWESTGTMLALVNRHSGVPNLVVPDFTRQQWKPRGNSKKCWIGVLKGEPPLPEELERWEQIAGAVMTDPGHYEWRVPVARMPAEGLPFGHLPQSYVFSDAGEPEGRLQPAYQWLFDLSGQLRDWYVQTQDPDDEASVGEKAAHEKPPFTWLVKQAARVLGVNYRVEMPELTFLHELGREVLTQATVHGVCQATFAFDLVVEAKKKPPEDSPGPAPSSSSSTTGDETPAESPGTVPVGAG